jgi:hypothetical protein
MGWEMYAVLFGTPEERVPLENLGLGGRIILI